jgi:hypothetical protein
MRRKWGGLPVITKDSEEPQTSAELVEEDSASLFVSYTRETVNAFGAKALIHLYVVLHNTHKLSENGRHKEYRNR